MGRTADTKSNPFLTYSKFAGERRNTRPNAEERYLDNCRKEAMIVLWGLVGPMLGPPWGGLVGGSWGGGIRRWLGAHESRRGSRELGFCGSCRNVPGRRARRFATQVSTLVSPEPTAERHGLECRETRLETRHVRTPERRRRKQRERRTHEAS